MVDNWLPAGALEIDKLEITSYSNKTLDIRGMVEEFSVHDDIQKSFLTSTFVITDSLSLLTQFPIIGQETIALSFRTPHPAFTKSVTVNLRVIAIEKLGRMNSRNTRYILKCVSLEYVKDIRTKIRKSYANMLISDMVNKVFTEFINTDATQIAASTTEGTRTIVIPNMSPSAAMKFLARESKSTDYPASNFCFFQTADGFFFKTIDEMIVRKPATGPLPPVDNYFTTDFNTFSDTASPNSIGVSGSAGGSGGASRQTTKPFEFLKMIDFTFIQMEQYDKVTRVGALESLMRILDPAVQSYTTKTYNYFTDYDKFKRTAQNVDQKFMVQQNEYIVTGDSKQFLQITNQTQQNNYNPDQKVDFMQYDQASRGMLDNILVNVTIPGDSEKRAGQIVNLQFPEYGGTDDVIDKPNKFVSGAYLVTATRHIYTGSGYKTAMLCVKNAFEEEIT